MGVSKHLTYQIKGYFFYENNINSALYLLLQFSFFENPVEELMVGENLEAFFSSKTANSQLQE